MRRALLLAGFLSLCMETANGLGTTDWVLTAISPSADAFADDSLAETDNGALNVTSGLKDALGVTLGSENASVVTLASQGQGQNSKAAPPTGNTAGRQGPGLLTKAQKDLAMDVLQKCTYAILPVALLVTVFNVTVFAQKSLRCSTSKYVISLSILQISFLLIDIAGRVTVATLTKSIVEEYGYFVYSIYGNSCIVVIRRVSFVITCLVSLERLYAIVRPMHVKNFVLVRYPLCFIVASVVLTTVYHFYMFAKLQIVEIVLPGGRRMYNVLTTDFFNRNAVAMEALGISGKVLFSYLPLLTMMTLNILTLIFLQRHRAARRKMKTSSNAEDESKRQRAMTITILGATICYVTLSLPLAFHALFDNFHPNYNYWGSEQNIFVVFQEFAYVCHMLSCFTDFLSFLVLSSAYRRTFVRLFCFAARYLDTKRARAVDGNTKSIVTEASGVDASVSASS